MIYDVFLSHASDDKPAVEALARRLRDDDLEPFLDKWHLIPGKPWQEALEEALETSRTCAVFVGAQIGPWQNEELRAALAERVREKEFRVIPVLLPGAPMPEKKKLPRFLQRLIWVEFQTLEDRDAYHRLLCGIRGVPPQPPGDEPQPAWRNERVRELSEQLSDLYARRETTLIAGQPTNDIDRRILDVRRQIRQGPLLQPGEFLSQGRYRLLERAGKGGFAEVWKAWDTAQRGLVAIKCLHGQHSEDRTRRERFFRGARKMGELAHPRIVRVLEAEGREEGWHYFVMEYVGGGNFEEAVLDGTLDPETRLAVVQQTGEALAHAHRQGIVHRDVKPSNILLDADGHAKLTDFDLVAAGDSTGGTKTHAMLGTLLFAAPEALLSAKDAGPAADVYSLAVTAVFAMQGQPLHPLFFRDPEATITRLGCGKPARDVLRKAMAVDPGARYASVGEFCGDLQRTSESVREPAPAPPHPKAGSAVTRKHAVPEALQFPDDRKKRSEAFEGIPDRLGDADACLAWVEQWKEGCRNGFDLFWLWWIMEEVERRWRPGGRAWDLLAHFFDHIPPPNAPKLLWTLDTPLDGPVPLWREIPAGKGQVGDGQTSPQHRVEMVDSYWLGVSPVTNAQYALLDPGKEFRHWPGTTEKDLATHPRAGITWYEAVNFCRWLATQPGFEGSEPRLPVEEEWEYACRAGTVSRFWRGDGEEYLAEVGWYTENSGNRTHRVGRKPADAWQLYDLHGNVWEWTASPWARERYKGRPQRSAWRLEPAALAADLAAPPRARRVLRGGSCGSTARRCRSAFRDAWSPRDVIRDLGFRVLLSSAPSRPLIFDL